MGSAMSSADPERRSGLWGLKFPESSSEVRSVVDYAWSKLDETVEMMVSRQEKPTFENTVVLLTRELGRVVSVVNVMTFYSNVAVDEEIREACREIEGEFGGRFSSVMSRQDLYLLVKQVDQSLSGRLRNRMDSLDRRLLGTVLADFEESGVNLPTRRREKLLELRERLGELSVEFDKNMSEDKSSIQLAMMELSGCDAGLMERTRVCKHSSYVYHEVSDCGDVMSILSDCTNEMTRRKVSQYWSSRSLENLKVLEDLHQVRTEIAQLLGHDSSSHHKLEGEMMKNPENALFFLDHVLELLDSSTRAYLEELVEMKNSDVNTGGGRILGNSGSRVLNGRKRKRLVDLEPWDYLHYHNQYLREKHGVDHQFLREYFPTDHVLSQMLLVFSQILGLEFENVTHSYPKLVYHPSVEIYSVSSGAGAGAGSRSGSGSGDGLIGHFILDLYPREGKHSHFCEMDVTCGFLDTDSVDSGNSFQRLPVVALLGNFPEGSESEGGMALLTHEEVETMFHEFGHVIHAICGGHQAKYYQFSGNRVETDFNETPSEMFEQWAWEPWILKIVSRHYRDSSALSDKMIHDLVESRWVGACREWTRLACLSKIDLTIHSRRRLNSGEMVSLAKDMNESYLYQRSCGRMLATWGHIGSYDYDSLNYSYVWSMVLACDIYSRFREAGNDLSEVRRVGNEFREDVLEPGGTVRAWKLVKNFLGRAPNARAFLVDLLKIDPKVVDKKMEDLNFESSTSSLE